MADLMNRAYLVFTRFDCSGCTKPSGIARRVVVFARRRKKHYLDEVGRIVTNHVRKT